jgi:hypothetical protein
MLGSMFLVVCYFFVVQQLRNNKEVMFKNNFLHLSSIFWVGFFVLAAISFVLMSHFINIEYNCKVQIKRDASNKLTLVDSIATVYKKRAKVDIQNFEVQLDGALTQYKASNSNILRNKLELAPFSIESNVLNNASFINVNNLKSAKITPYQRKIDINIKNIDSTFSYNNNNFQKVFDNWERLSVVVTYNKLNQYVEDNRKFINSKVSELPLDKTEIEVNFPNTQLPLNSPSKLNAIYPPNYLLPSLFIFFTHLFILISFFTRKIETYVKSNSSDPLEIENVRVI